jgi:HPr kinase/phosphorylase
VSGLAEHSYLCSLESSAREERLRGFFARHVPCVVLTRGKPATREMIRLAEEYRTPLLRTPAITKIFVNAATIIMENLMAPHTKVLGTMVEILGIGVLIEGKPGMGKSEAALGLIKKGHALVSDDVTALRRDSAGAIVASPIDVTRYHMEIRGLGIIHVPSLFGVSSVREDKKLDLVATLVPQGEGGDGDRGGGLRTAREIMGVQIPQVIIELAPGRDIANIIEAAALDQKLRRLGHDAAKELDERLIALMQGGVKDVSE